MSPEGWAAKAESVCRSRRDPDDERSICLGCIADVIRAAVLEEREACGLIAANSYDITLRPVDVARLIALKIAERGKTESAGPGPVSPANQVGGDLPAS